MAFYNKLLALTQHLQKLETLIISMFHDVPGIPRAKTERFANGCTYLYCYSLQLFNAKKCKLFGIERLSFVPGNSVNPPFIHQKFYLRPLQ